MGRLTGAKTKGFTLLEVVLALAILAVALTTLSTLQARNLTLTAEDTLLTEGVIVARDLMARIQSKALPLEAGQGDMGQEYSGWHWSMRVEELGAEGLLKVTIFLLKEGIPEERALRFWFLAYRGKPQ